MGKMESWIKALNGYFYPVNLSCYENSNRFPNYFEMEITGDRDSTIAFEDYFRKNARRSIEVYFEVVFWKLYSQKQFRQKGTTRIINHLNKRIHPESLYDAITHFVETPNKQNLKNIRELLGMKSKVLAIALTFPAFFNSEKYPMVDNNVARWVTTNFIKHNRNKQTKLTPFAFGGTSLQDNDFQNYLNWVAWCNEMAEILTDKTSIEWRPRDVEMAIFTAKRKELKLNVL